ncbi:hypothetical protein [Hyalangium versicolor]|uniref:hypothetical protein n=1 Tax=Hyalangium versicolor TaxID=2861190 RepID=UPI001CCDB1E4|nr:hypothetical protein [Hyalangium versicolor]
MAKSGSNKTSTPKKKSTTKADAKSRIRKLTMVELEQVVGGNKDPDTSNYVTYSRFEGNTGRFGSTC